MDYVHCSGEQGRVIVGGNIQSWMSEVYFVEFDEILWERGEAAVEKKFVLSCRCYWGTV